MHAKAVVRHGLAGPFFSPGGKKGIVPGPGEGPCAASVALDERPSGAGHQGGESETLIGKWLKR
ncbi:hypothetical protein, partial [Pseudomonas aeruginosa]|uniref:hypothetical protein n=1 Tax=Pseudomonas aeruginosa TaxID=287 RepID=UPI0019D6A8C3